MDNIIAYGIYGKRICDLNGIDIRTSSSIINNETIFTIRLNKNNKSLSLNINMKELMFTTKLSKYFRELEESVLKMNELINEGLREGLKEGLREA